MGFSGLSNFLQKFKNMIHRLIEDSKLFLGVSVSACVALRQTDELSRVYPAFS